MPAIAIAAALASPLALAQTPPPDNQDRRQCSAQELANCLDGVGGGVTSLDSLRINTGSRGGGAAESEERAQQQARGAVPGVTSGVAAGNGAAGAWTVWGTGGFSSFESDVANAPYEADSYNLLMGADRFFGDSVVAGFNFGYENVDTETFYNGGGQDRDGITVGLYGAFLINDTFSFDVATGYSSLDTDENRLDPGTAVRVGAAATPGATLLGTYDSRRAYFTANLNAVRSYGNWVVGARLGALHAVESQDAYAESGGAGARTIRKRHIDLTQAYGSVDVGYSAGAFEPYAVLEYRNDLGRDDGNAAGGLPGGVRTQPTDDDEWQGGVGVRYFGDNGITGNLEWLRTEGRESFDNDSVSLTVRVPF